MEMIFRIIGVLGLLGIIIGVLIKNEKRQDVFFIAGGFLLLVYSVYINDIVFVVLQLVFIGVALAELVQLARRPSLWKRIRNKLTK